MICRMVRDDLLRFSKLDCSEDFVSFEEKEEYECKVWVFLEVNMFKWKLKFVCSDVDDLVFNGYDGGDDII